MSCAIEREGDVGGEKAELRAAVVGAPVEAHAMERLRPGELDHAVGQLDLAARALLDRSRISKISGCRM